MAKLTTGGVLPYGLINIDNESSVSGFEKSYRNFVLRSGIIVRSYSVDNDLNISKLVPEYDVVVIEQDEDRAVTPITFKNCIAASSFGSIADYFEARLRKQEEVKNKQSEGRDFNGQDGALVLMLCLDGYSDKAVIIGSLNHPDRKSKIVGDTVLAGEFNGIEVSIKEDGSANLTFKGATDNQGKPLDDSQGDTEFDIETDGSVQLKHDGATLRIEKEGDTLLTNKGKTSITSEKDISLTTNANFMLKATGNAQMSMNQLTINAQGSALVEGQTLTISGKSSVEINGPTLNVNSSTVAINSSSVVINGSVSVGGAGGLPVVLPTTKVLVIGNLGIPTIGTMIGPFSQKSLVN